MHTDAFESNNGVSVVIGEQFAPSITLGILQAEMLDVQLKAAIEAYNHDHAVSTFESEGGLYV